MAITYMTKEGYDKKMKEIAYLESVERPRISAAIAEARDKGDLSENSEYDAAKEAQGMLEMKISQLKDMLASARIIDEAKLNTEEVQIMNTVTIKNTKNGANHCISRLGKNSHRLDAYRTRQHQLHPPTAEPVQSGGWVTCTDAVGISFPRKMYHLSLLD